MISVLEARQSFVVGNNGLNRRLVARLNRPPSPSDAWFEPPPDDASPYWIADPITPTTAPTASEVLRDQVKVKDLSRDKVSDFRYFHANEATDEVAYYEAFKKILSESFDALDPTIRQRLQKSGFQGIVLERTLKQSDDTLNVAGYYDSQEKMVHIGLYLWRKDPVSGDVLATPNQKINAILGHELGHVIDYNPAQNPKTPLRLQNEALYKAFESDWRIGHPKGIESTYESVEDQDKYREAFFKELKYIIPIAKHPFGAGHDAFREATADGIGYLITGRSTRSNTALRLVFPTFLDTLQKELEAQGYKTKPFGPLHPAINPELRRALQQDAAKLSPDQKQIFEDFLYHNPRGLNEGKGFNLVHSGIDRLYQEYTQLSQKKDPTVSEQQRLTLLKTTFPTLFGLVEKAHKDLRTFQKGTSP